jgi:outer membrane lipoprotein-sorting protein
MDRRGRAVAAVVLVVLVLTAGAIFLDTNGDVEEADLEERYRAVDDYSGTMRIETVVVGPTENTTFYVENDAGEFVANRSLLPERPSFEGPSRVLVDNETVTVREFQPAVTPNGSSNRTIRAVTRRGSGVVANRTVVADVTYRSPDRYRYDYVEPPSPDHVTLTIDGDRATLYERGGEVAETATARLGIETLGIRFADVVDGMTDRYRVERIGRASVMGRSTNVLALVPTGNVSQPVDRLWVDDETGLPIRVRSNTTVGNRNVTTTVTYLDMAYDTGVSEDVFEVDVASLPPAREDGAAAGDGNVSGGADTNGS